MNYKKPKTFKGVPVNQKTLDEVLKGTPSTIVKPTIIIPTTNNDYIYVPELGLEVAKERTHFGLNWNKTHEVLQAERMRMLTPKEFFTFINYLQSNPTPKYSQILDDILKIRNQWQGEWLDAKFTKSGKVWNIESKDANQNLADCICEDTYVNLDAINSQGLPTQKSPQQSYQQGQNIYYWHPRNNAVAGFVAVAVRAFLFCDVGAEYSDASLGVRPSRKKN